MDKLIILTGPTGVGKSDLSIKLAKQLDGEIISADCMQIYKYMDIGTAKITQEEMQGVKHHLIDCIDPAEDFHVVRFQQLFKEAVADIYSRGKLPIVCGGTGFYIQAVLYDIHFSEMDIDEEYRNSLEKFAEQNGNEALHDMLKAVDEESAKAIPANNRKRVIRALEYHKQTGQKISVHNKEEKLRTSPYNFAYFVLNDDRQVLYNRIDKRVDKMISAGLVEEVRKLVDMGYHRGQTSMDGIGYKEMLDYLEGRTSLEDTINIIKQSSRRYAKRQLTWFRGQQGVHWLDRTLLTTDDMLLTEINRVLSEKGIT